MSNIPINTSSPKAADFSGADLKNKTQKPAANWLMAVMSAYLVSTAPAQAAKINIPTDLPPSPLCIKGRCAEAFTAKLLQFEELGLQALPAPDSTFPSTSLPKPADCFSSPDGLALDNFLKEGLHAFPTRRSDQTDAGVPIVALNPWDAQIRDCVGLSPQTPTVADGRPPGEAFAHQRWDEFFPKTYFQSVMSGARVNGGVRDQSQLHQYKTGEFAPGGLYHLPNGTTQGIAVQLHPDLPLQNPNSVWTFDGTFPPKLVMARYGEPVLFRHYDTLPIDVGANNGFGAHTITTHEHNGHNPGESDGFMHAFFFPGEFYDYQWTMVLAGHDSINTLATDPRAGAPDGHGGIIQIPGDWRETMSSHWFHDHMLDFTAPNVYKGNAAMMNFYSAVDRGREPANDLEAAGSPAIPGYGCHYNAADPKNPGPNNVNLCLPSGSGLDWGNRDYDMNLVVADKAWDEQGQLHFNIFNTDGFLGDRVTVNWFYKPYVDVRARRYRFRVLDGSVSRDFKIAVVDETGKILPSYMVANDGNIMEHSVLFPNAQSEQGAWPELTISERFDMIIDFKGLAGKKVYLVNLLEHGSARTPGQVIALADVLSGKYKADGINGDPAVGKFLEFRVQNYTGTDRSMNPADYVDGKKPMIPINRPTPQELKTALHRTFHFGRSSGTDNKPWTINTDGGPGLNADEHRISAAPKVGATEIWHIRGSKGWTHPIHVHFEEGQVFARDGNAPPDWEKFARKDVYLLGPTPDDSEGLDLVIRFREFAGTFMEHCHNTQHEDKAMLLRWDAEHLGQTTAIPAPEPDWDGVQYEPGIYLPTAKTGDLDAQKSFVLPK